MSGLEIRDLQKILTAEDAKHKGVLGFLPPGPDPEALRPVGHRAWQSDHQEVQQHGNKVCHHNNIVISMLRRKSFSGVNSESKVPSRTSPAALKAGSPSGNAMWMGEKALN